MYLLGSGSTEGWTGVDRLKKNRLINHFISEDHRLMFGSHIKYIVHMIKKCLV